MLFLKRKVPVYNSRHSPASATAQPLCNETQLGTDKAHLGYYTFSDCKLSNTPWVDLSFNRLISVIMLQPSKINLNTIALFFNQLSPEGLRKDIQVVSKT